MGQGRSVVFESSSWTRQDNFFEVYHAIFRYYNGSQSYGQICVFLDIFNSIYNNYLDSAEILMHCVFITFII